MGLFDNKQIEPNVITTTVEWLFNWARKSSPWPMTFGLACCAIEMMLPGPPASTLTVWGRGSFARRRASPM